MNNTDTIEDISTLIGGFYNLKKTYKDNYEIGQIVYVPTLEIPQYRQVIGDNIQIHSYKNKELIMHLRVQEEQDFRNKTRRSLVQPLENLQENHELVLSRAKKRPCLILAQSRRIDVFSLPAGVQRNKALKAFYPFYFLAPLYSVSTPLKPTTFGEVLTARIKCLVYPQFFYMPPSEKGVFVPSIARFDHLFVNQLNCGVDPTDLFVIPEVLEICHDQLKQLMGSESSKEFKEAQEILLSYLDEN